MLMFTLDRKVLLQLTKGDLPSPKNKTTSLVMIGGRQLLHYSIWVLFKLNIIDRDTFLHSS